MSLIENFPSLTSLVLTCFTHSSFLGRFWGPYRMVDFEYELTYRIDTHDSCGMIYHNTWLKGRPLDRGLTGVRMSQLVPQGSFHVLCAMCPFSNVPPIQRLKNNYIFRVQVVRISPLDPLNFLES